MSSWEEDEYDYDGGGSYGKPVCPPLDETALYFRHVEVKGFRALKSVSLEFGPQNIIVGKNGSGKTTFMNLLATIAGNDAATDIHADEPIGEIAVEMVHGSSTYVFEATGRLDRGDIERFKASLPMGLRANYSLPETGQQHFVHGWCNFATFEDKMAQYMRRYSLHHSTFLRPGHSATLAIGDGLTQGLRLLLMSSIEHCPLLLDGPSMHLDSTGKKVCARLIRSNDKQSIAITHDPEWGMTDEKYMEI